MINIVLLHGWGCDSRTWAPLLPGLKKIANINAIDLPGFGLSQEAEEFLLPEVLETLAAKIADDSVVIGWSLGGMLAVQLAAQFPKKVRALVTLAANAKFVASDSYPAAMPAAVNSEFNRAFKQGPAATLKIFYGLLAQGDAQERALLKTLRQQMPTKFSAQWLQALSLLSDLDNRTVLTALKQPALHLFAEKDSLVPVAAAESCRELNPAHQVTVIAQAAHAVHWSKPKAVLEKITHFLRHEVNEPFALDKKKVAQSFGRAAATYDTVAQLQRDVGKHLSQHLPALLADDVNLLDLGSGTGFFTRQLAVRYESANVIALDIAEGMLHFSRQRVDKKSLSWLCADAEQLPLAANSVDLVFSSLVIQWCADLSRLMHELARVLKPGGQLLIATLGPNTLHELRSAWQRVDNYVHVNQFQPQDNLRLAAVAADLAIDHFAVEQRIIYFERLTELTRELKALGAHNINAGKPEGLTGRHRVAAFKAAYEQFREARGLPATYEVFYLAVRKRSTGN